MALADRLLSRGSAGPSPYPPDRHPDCLQVRPAGKSRSITVDAVRDLVGRVNVSPSVSRCKVAVLHDADRMNAAAANIFLKTLEEPPADTTLLLLTGRPHALLPTIRSRVLHFRFPGLSVVRPGRGLGGLARRLPRVARRASVAAVGAGPRGRRRSSSPSTGCSPASAPCSTGRAPRRGRAGRRPCPRGSRRRSSRRSRPRSPSACACGCLRTLEEATRAHAIELLEAGDGAVAAPAGRLDRQPRARRLACCAST